GEDAAAAKQISEPLNANEVFQVTRATASPIEETPCTGCFPGLPGAEWNIQYGYGRPSLYNAMRDVHEGNVPPTADITAPEWYDQVDPTKQSTVNVSANVAAKRSPSYTWEIQYAAGPQPTEAEFHTIASGSGTAPQTVNGSIDLSQIPESFWAGAYTAPTADRLAIERYDVTVRVRVTDASSRLGEDCRVFQLRHDPSEVQ